MNRAMPSQPTQGRECDEPLLICRCLPTTRTRCVSCTSHWELVCVCTQVNDTRVLSPPPCGRDTGVAGVARFARQAKPVYAQRTERIASILSFLRWILRSILSSAREITRTTRQSCTIMLSHHRYSGPPRVPRAVSKAKVGTTTARPCPWPSPPATSARHRLLQGAPVYFPTGRWWVTVQ